MVGVALAQSWNEKKEVSGWIVSEKLDGMRCLWDGDTRLLSRTGHLIHAPPSFIASLPRGTALDGELWLGRGGFQECMRIVRRQDMPETWSQIRYVVFDAPDAEGGIFERLKVAEQAIAPGGRAIVLDYEVCRDVAHMRAKLQEVEALGGEGLVLRHPTASHRAGRTPDLLKVKSAHDDEAMVDAHIEGKGKHTGRLGALSCHLRSGKQFKIGTGFSDAERLTPPSVGSVVTFRYSELTEGGIPRFPAFLRIRPDVDWVYSSLS